MDLGIYVERAVDRSFGDGNILALIPKAAKRLRMKSIEVTKEWSGTSARGSVSAGEDATAHKSCRCRQLMTTEPESRRAENGSDFELRDNISPLTSSRLP